MQGRFWPCGALWIAEGLGAIHGGIRMGSKPRRSNPRGKGQAGERALRYVWLAVVHGCGDGGANAQ